MNNNTLFIHDQCSGYRPATPSEILAAAPKAARTCYRKGSDLSSFSDALRMFTARLSDQPDEEFHIAYLTSRHHIIAVECAFTGTVDGAAVYPRPIIRRCLELNAAAIMVAHNHPSGDSEPSAADRGITNKIKSALEHIDVRLLDHFVIGNGESTSFAGRGWL